MSVNTDELDLNSKFLKTHKHQRIWKDTINKYFLYKNKLLYFQKNKKKICVDK